MSGVAAGVATTLPVLAFATVGALAPALVQRAGLVPSLLVADSALATGLLLRGFSGNSVVLLLTWTAVATSGIAVANVLLPSLVAKFFSHRVGPVTGAYTMAMQAGSAAGAGLTVPLARAWGGWHFGLGSWALLALVALPPWVVVYMRLRPPGAAHAPSHQAANHGPSSDQPERRIRLQRSGVAWGLAVFFGMQALAAYVVMGWLPQIFKDAGLSPGKAGMLLAVVLAVSAPMALALPIIANRLSDQRILVVVVSLAMGFGYIGLAVAPASGSWLWSASLGIGQGAFPLALGMIGLRARSASITTSLSAFTQSIGYVFAAFGPFAVGALHQLSGTWAVPLILLTVLLIPQLCGGLLAGRNRYVED